VGRLDVFSVPPRIRQVWEAYLQQTKRLTHHWSERASRVAQFSYVGMAPYFATRKCGKLIVS
jgi:hypothetical protein